MSRYNLIEEKWIPVRFLNGERSELGICDTLLRAKEIESIEDDSPLVVASLHRFLLAVLYRALEGPADIEQAKRVFRNGLPLKKITSYLKDQTRRFDLFDSEYPFGQNPNVPKNEIEPWTKLTAEHNATSNKVLFDHTDTTDPGSRHKKECARWLISTMTFSVSGGRGYYPSPSCNAMMCIPLGRNLQETLSYNLVPYPNKKVTANDSALWERSPEKIPLKIPKRAVRGYADLYTWPSRMVLLEETPTGRVANVRFIAGQGCENPSNIRDPMQPYRIDKKDGATPLRFRQDRATWRDFDSLLPDGGELPALTLENALRIAGKDSGMLPKSVLAVGLRYEPPNANVDFWRMERFVFPSTVISDRNVREEIRQLLDIAEEAQKSLWAASRSFAQDILSRGEGNPVPEDVKGVVNQMGLSALYWSVMEAQFHETLHGYSDDNDFDNIRSAWLKCVRDTLRASWNDHASSLQSGDAWAIRAMVKAERIVGQRLIEIDKKLQKLYHKKEVA